MNGPAPDSDTSEESNTSEKNCNDQSNPRVRRDFKKSERLLSWFFENFQKCIYGHYVKTNPFDTLVLRAHYSFLSNILFALFFFITSSWYIETPIICLDRSDRTPAPPELLDICYSYPYVEYPYKGDMNRMIRRYALHYRWVSIACLVIGFLFKGVLAVMKMISFTKFNKMLQRLSDTPNPGVRFEIARKYYIGAVGSHTNMYSKIMLLHVMALIVNVLCFVALNICFQNQYWDLPKNLLVKRQPDTFHDRFSLIFPPFTKCEVTEVHQILLQRTKWFGCHLTLNAVYEKVFMIFWFLQSFIAVWTLLYLFSRISFPRWTTWSRYYFFNSSLNCHDPYKKCSEELHIDDLSALSAVKRLLTLYHYLKLLKQVGGCEGSCDESMDPNDTKYFDLPNDLSTRNDALAPTFDMTGSPSKHTQFFTPFNDSDKVILGTPSTEPVRRKTLSSSTPCKDKSETLRFAYMELLEKSTSPVMDSSRDLNAVPFVPDIYRPMNEHFNRKESYDGRPPSAPEMDGSMAERFNQQNLLVTPSDEVKSEETSELLSDQYNNPQKILENGANGTERGEGTTSQGNIPLGFSSFRCPFMSSENEDKNWD